MRMDDRIRVPSKPGDVLAVGAVVDEVVQISETCGVYITQGDKLHWTLDDADSRVDYGRSITTAVDLLTQLTALALPKGQHRRGLKIIGTSLHDALIHRVENDRRNYFARAEEFVTTQLRERLQIWYFVMALLSTILSLTIMLSLWLFFESLTLYVLAGVMGGVGAFVSVAQRFRLIPIERYASYSYTALGGVSRIVFGVIFGEILLLMQKAGLVLALATTAPALLAVACLIAGFSERLIPELLTQFEVRLAEHQQKVDGTET